MSRTITKTVYTYAELREMAKNATGIQKKQLDRTVEKAGSWLREIATSDKWWDDVYETWTNALDQIGFTDADISFSGFWSQGDGASFKSGVDIERLVHFFTSDIIPQEGIEPLPHDFFGHNENYRAWIVHKAGSKVTSKLYRHIQKMSEIGAIDSACVERSSSRYSHSNTCRFTARLNDRGDYSDPNSSVIKWSPGNWVSRTPKCRALFEDFCRDAEDLRRELCGLIYTDLQTTYEFLTADEQLEEMCDANEWHFDIHGRRDW